MALNARIEKGKIVADAPPGYEEGERLQIEIVDDDDLTKEEREELDRSLAAGICDIKEERHRSAAEVVGNLESKRR
jgi:hypothetical protein